MEFYYSQLFVRPAWPTRSFAGETCILTGANVGLGKEAVRHLARLGATKIIMACRNTQAGEEARQDILTSTSVDPNIVEVWQLDLGSFESVKAFSKRASDLARIDVLLENAGIATGVYKDVEGHESTLTVNVISTFLLALELLPKMKTTAKKYNTTPRLSIVTSEVHGWAEFAEQNESNIFKTLDGPSSANMRERYSVSKLLQVLVVRHVAPKLEGSGVVVNTLNPGLCSTSLARNVQSLRLTLKMFFLARTSEVGSRTLVAAAAAGEESHGKYMSDGVIAEGALSTFAKNEQGAKVGAKVWHELSGILEKIEPGVTANV